MLLLLQLFIALPHNNIASSAPTASAETTSTQSSPSLKTERRKLNINPGHLQSGPDSQGCSNSCRSELPLFGVAPFDPIRKMLLLREWLIMMLLMMFEMMMQQAMAFDVAQNCYFVEAVCQCPVDKRDSCRDCCNPLHAPKHI